MFLGPKNFEKRRIFYALYRQQHKKFYKDYKAFLKYTNKTNKTIPLDFFDFIRRYAEQNEISLKQVHNCEKVHKQFSLYRREKVTNFHPLVATVKIVDKALTILYKQGSSTPNASSIDELINQMVEHANYTNLFLCTIGSQLIHLENSIHIPKTMPSSSETSSLAKSNSKKKDSIHLP